jgi:UDP-arabinose 4-epimerase
VSGGAGYIGSQVCKHLKESGYIPVTLDNLSQGHLWSVQWGPLVQADIQDERKVKEAIHTFKPIAAIHLASSINVRDSLRDPFFYYENNVTATLQFLKTLTECGVTNFVFSSSAAVYGQPTTVPIPEEHLKLPLHPYGKSKLMVEEMLQDLSRAHGMRFAALRYFNAAGADLEGKIGEAHDPETHLIPLAILAALGLRPSLKIFGRDFPTPDGTAIRDYIHVQDLAAAHLKALLWILSEKKNLIVNLGTGTGHSVKEVIDAVEKITGRKIPLEESPRVAEDPTALVANATKAKKLLEWEPRYSSLETIIETACSWHQKHLEVQAQAY